MSKSKFKICEILGVDTNEIFKVKLGEKISKTEYWVDDRGRLVEADCFGDMWVVSGTFIYSLINEEFEVYKGE